MDFSKFKANRGTSAQKLAEQIAKENAPAGQQVDERFWKPTLDKEKGTGGAVIRFLPVPDEETLAYVTWHQHSFQYKPTGKWYIERSLTSIGQQDAIAELNRRLWATNDAGNRKIASAHKRNQRYVSNILVVNDPAKPENNGKVFLFEYGPAIFTKEIDVKLNPKPDELTGVTKPVVNPYDMWDGENFNLRMVSTQYGWNYDNSDWGVAGPIGDDDYIQKIYEQLTPLSEFIDVKHYKSKDALTKRLVEVIGSPTIGSPAVPVLDGDFTVPFEVDAPAEAAAPAQSVASTTTQVEIPAAGITSSTVAIESSEADDDFFDTLMGSKS